MATRDIAGRVRKGQTANGPLPRLGARMARPGGGFLCLLLALPALWPLIRAGFLVSDDGRFHVYRIAALAQAWSQGVLHPRLFPEFGFGYGQAVLNFYAPLAYWPGALLALLGAGPAAAAKLSIALGFLLAGLAAYGYGRYVWGTAGGLLAAVAYTYFPYHLADAYLRGAIPEHFAFIWPPLILWAYTAAFREAKPLAPWLWGALAWAGLVYTHNLTALLMAPVAALYLLMLAARSGHWRRLIPAAGSLALALGLSAAYWLPVLAESRSVGIGLGTSEGYREHLAPLAQLILTSPFYRYRLPSAGADHPLSWLTALLIVLVVLLWAWRALRRQRVREAGLLGFSLALTIGSVLMTSQPSLPAWRAFGTVLAYLQYPWRFLSLAAVGVMGLAGALGCLLPHGARPGAIPAPDTAAGAPSAAERVSSRAAVHPPVRFVAAASLLALALMLVPLRYLPAQPLALPDAEAWTPERMWREDEQAGQVGATWTGEFLPQTVQEQRWALGRARDGATDGPVLTPQPSASLTRLSYLGADLALDTPAPLALRLHQFAQPGWQARLDGRTVPVYPSGELGLVTVDVPAGSHSLALRFGATPARVAGGLLATLSVGIWAWLALRSGRQRVPVGRASRVLAVAGSALLLFALVLDLNALGVGRQSVDLHPVSARVGDEALLLGYSTAPARGADALDVTFYWLALRDTGTNYRAFVHLLDGAGTIVAQHDEEPGGTYTPTSRWRSGEIIADRHRLALQGGRLTGAYQLKAGLYKGSPPENLPIDPPAPDGRAALGTVLLPPTQR